MILNSKRAKNVQKKMGFAKHVQSEIKIKSDLSSPDLDLNLESSLFSRRSMNNNDAKVFIESAGAVELYSIKELQYLHDNAKRIFGDDRERFVKDILLNLSKKQNRRNLAGPPTDPLIKQLRINFPNFNEAIDQIEYAAALSKLSHQNWFQMPPLLLLGPPGVGKTAFAQEFAQLLGVYFKRIDVGAASTGSILSGLSLGWGSGHAGEIFKVINESKTANPLIMLDEIDKTSASRSYPIEPTLLSLLEKESAQSFTEEATQMHLNCKHFLWMATANNSEYMTEPLKSRFTIVHIRPPNKQEIKQIIRNIYKKIRASNPWGNSFNNEINDLVIEALIDYSPRELTRILQISFGRAALRNSNELSVQDLVLPIESSKMQIGFY